MRKKSELPNKALTAGKFRFRKDASPGAVFALMTLAVVLVVVFPCEACCDEEDEAVALPSRFAGASEPMSTDDTTEMVAEWMYATGAAGGAESLPPSPSYEHLGERRYFSFGMGKQQIDCQVSRTTDIELEPGERVENFAVTDGEKWSISAAWSGSVDNIVTHVLLRTFFPGVKSNLRIFTDRRVYELELVSGIDVGHVAYVGFRYPRVPGSEPEPEEIEPGKYRDLLVHYGIIGGGGEEPKGVRRVDGAELNFRYVIKHLGKTRPPWTPRSVYDADGKTYIVMPRRQTKGEPSLFIVSNGERVLANITVVKEGLHMVERVFDEAVMKMGNDEVSIKRVRVPD